MSAPSFSIVLTCYRHASFIAEALRSIFAQDYDGEMELIVVDDASPDDSVAVIRDTIARYGLGWQVRVIVNEKNAGVAAATDIGWQAARYDWIVEADGDDIQHMARCSQTADIIRRFPQAGFIAMSQSCVDAAGQEQSRRYMLPSLPPDAELMACEPAERAAVYLERVPESAFGKGVYGCSLAIRRDVVQRWGALSTADSPRFAQDLPWEARAFLIAPLVRSNRIACAYRAHDFNIYNRERVLRSVDDWVQYELAATRYAAFERDTHAQILSDFRRACAAPQLSDWQVPDLQAACAMQQQLVLAHHLRSTWWSRSVFARLWSYVSAFFSLASAYRAWFLLRLLPLRLVAILRRMRHRST